MELKLEENEILVLCSCDKNGLSYDKFQFNLEVGAVVDFAQKPGELDGIYGLPWGVGNADVFNFNEDDFWLLIRVDTTTNYEKLNDRCVFQKGTIEYIGNIQETISLLEKYVSPNTPIICLNQESRDLSIQISGDKSNQTAGASSVQITENNSQQTARNNSSQTAGNGSFQTTSHESTQISKNNSTQISNSNSRQIAEDYSIQKVGSESIQKAGYKSKQEAEQKSIQLSGDESYQIAGMSSVQISGKNSRQIVQNKSFQFAGIGTIQTCIWYANDVKTTTSRVVDSETAEKWYYVEDGKWILKNFEKEFFDNV